MKFDEKTRGWIYRILVAVGVLLGGYGVLTGEQIAMWLGLVVAALNIMPTANTTVKSTKNEDVVL